jgi:hypothetical protein
MPVPIWKNQLKDIHCQGLAAWQAGRRSPESMFGLQEAEFLASIGCSPQEMFDFIDDLAVYGEPDFQTVLGIQTIRYAFFRDVMNLRPSGGSASMDSLPPKSAAVDGIAWLPRLIAKARLKLRGEMPHELMYGCAGDRPFLRRMGMTLPSFLQLVWDNNDNDRAIVDSVKASAKSASL